MSMPAGNDGVQWIYSVATEKEVGCYSDYFPIANPNLTIGPVLSAW